MFPKYFRGPIFARLLVTSFQVIITEQAYPGTHRLKIRIKKPLAYTLDYSSPCASRAQGLKDPEESERWLLRIFWKFLVPIMTLVLAFQP